MWACSIRVCVGWARSLAVAVADIAAPRRQRYGHIYRQHLHKHIIKRDRMPGFWGAHNTKHITVCGR